MPVSDGHIMPSLDGNVTFITLGSIHSGWPENTTPIQRALFLSNFGNVIAIDTADKVSPTLSGVVEYLSTPNWNYRDICHLLSGKDELKSKNVVIWSSPSWKTVSVGNRLACKYNGKFVIDLFDDLRLPAGLAWANKQYLKAFAHEIMYLYSRRYTKRCDLLLRAVCMDAHKCNTPIDKQVSVMNGVCNTVLEMGRDWDNYKSDKDTFKACYIGHFDQERAGIFRHLIERCKNIQFDLEFHIVGGCSQDYVTMLEAMCEKLKHVKIITHGFLEWEKAMNVVSESDVCLYTFPCRPVLDCVYPIKLGEYLALGKPVISVALSGAKEMAGNCESVLFLNENDYDAWIKAFELLHNSPSRCMEMGSKARIRASELTWDKIHQKALLPALNRLLGQFA